MLNVISGTTGSGKTFTTRKQIVENINSTPYVCIVGKSIKFLEETASYFQSQGIKVIELHSEAVGVTSARRELSNLFNPMAKSDFYTTQSHVLLITTALWKTFTGISTLGKRYKTYHDEFDAKISGQVNFGTTLRKDDYIVVDPITGKITLTAHGRSAIRNGDGEDMSESELNLLMPLYLKNYSIFLTDEYNRKQNKKKTETITVKYIGFINENYYNDGDTIITQNAEYVNILLCNTQINNTIIEGKKMNKKINIINIQKDRLSKIKVEQNLEQYAQAYRTITERMESKFLLSANNVLKTFISKRLPNPNCILLNGNVEGLNEYRDVNNVLFLYSCNPKPKEFKIYKQQFDMDPEKIFELETLEKAKQIIARSSFREHTSTQEINIWVAGDSLAESLRDYYTSMGCDVSLKHDYMLNSFRKYNNPYGRAMTAAERQKEYRIRKRMEKLAQGAA